MGGATRHFETLLDDLEKSPVFQVTLVNTSRKQKFASSWNNIGTALKAATRVVGSLGKVDVVSYHASNRGMYLFGPVIALVCKLARKPVVLRIFGGSFGEYYSARGRLGRYIVRKTVFSADVILIQTKRTMAQLEQHSSGRLVWFATYVQMMGGKPARAQVPERASDRTCKKFVFLGHLWKTKGIDVILDAAALLPGDAGIDIYGPLDEYSESEIETRGQGRVRYCGFLTHGEVEERLADYDCLLLPTFHESEGYPGVIAEAFTCGLPVIATDWLAIPEMVDESCGILIPPKDAQALAEAIATMHEDSDRWNRLRAGALERANNFSREHWSERFEQICKELLADRALPE